MDSRSSPTYFRRFWTRRFARIFPVYFLMIGLYLLAANVQIVYPTLLGSQLTSSGVPLGPYLIFTQNIYMALFEDTGASMLGVTWSLAIEEHFYVVFPLLYLALLRLPRRVQGGVLASVCLGVLAWRCVLVFGFAADSDRTYFATDTRLDALLVGCLLAVVANPALDRVSFGTGRSLGVLLTGGVLVVVGEQIPERLVSTVGQTVQSIGLLLAFAAILAAPQTFVGRLLEWAPLARLGVLSYSFYLFHGVVLSAVQENSDWGIAPTAALAFAVTLALSQAVHVLVERPLARVRRRLTHQQPPPAALV